jgi:hypothetical protein
MRRVLRCAPVLGALLLCGATAASAALPRNGSLVPGQSLGGIRLGEPAAQVRSALGGQYGLCRGCRTTTWYFTYKPFTGEGLAVELNRGRVSAVYTIWRPSGWKGPQGLRLGDPEAEVTALAGPLIPITCAGYDALTTDAPDARTAYYIVDSRLWGFGILPAHTTPCR